MRVCVRVMWVDWHTVSVCKFFCVFHFFSAYWALQPQFQKNWDVAIFPFCCVTGIKIHERVFKTITFISLNMDWFVFVLY